ncbi:unnamed protein product, partial [Choristocarpus tenellus]
LRQHFAQFDVDKDGQISKNELRNVLEGLGETVSESQLQTSMNAADSDGDGKVCFSEMVEL